MTKSFIDQNLDKEVQGTATREHGRAQGRASKSPRRTSSTSPKTQFPTQHLVELIGKANKGENFYETNLFDGRRMPTR